MKRHPDPAHHLPVRCPLPWAGALATLLVATTGLATPAAGGAPQIESSRPTSFEEVTSQLDRGGTMYVYLSTEGWIDEIESKLCPIIDMAIASEVSDDEEREKATAVIELLKRVLDRSGVKQISGIGMSSVPVANDLYLNRSVIHHYRDQGDGQIWSMFGESPHPLEGLDLLPANTTVAWFSDFRPAQLWSWVKDEIANTDIEEVQEGFAQFQEGMGGEGIDLDALLASMAGEFGIALTLDEENPVEIPIEDQTLSIPAPAAMLVIRTNDDAIFKLLADNLPEEFERAEENGVRTLTSPPLPAPFPAQVTIAQTEEVLLVASTPSLIEASLAVAADEAEGLVDTDEFKALAEGLPRRGNGFVFVGERLGTALEQLQRKMLEQADAEEAFVLSQLSSASERFVVYGITRVTRQGFVMAGRSSVGAGQIMVLQAGIAPAAIGTAMLLPALSKARGKARQVACMSNLKQLDLALIMYANDNQDVFPAEDGAAGLREVAEYLPAPAVCVCPESDQSPPPDLESVSEDSLSYVYFGGFRMSSIGSPATLPLLFDKPGNHGNGVNVAFADGHVEWLQGEFWSCADVIDRLSEMHEYPDELLELLQEKAEAADSGESPADDDSAEEMAPEEEEEEE